MLCKSNNKDGPCKENATVTVFWPGKTTVSCGVHYLGQLRIAEAMGFSLDSRPLTEEEIKKAQ